MTDFSSSSKMSCEKSGCMFRTHAVSPEVRLLWANAFANSEIRLPFGDPARILSLMWP